MKRIALVFFVAIAPRFAATQIVPPGLGKTHLASWAAVGVQQKLDSLKHGRGWLSETYVGAGRMSNPEQGSPFLKPAIFILNQEFKNRFRDNWEYSLALSYRRQNEYERVPPYQHSSPPFKQELRFYARFSHIFKTDVVEITPTLRQEVQKFFGPHFTTYPENFRFRSRFRLKFSFPLTPDSRHRILLYSEQLFSISKMAIPDKWTNFDYRDSRFSLYYSVIPRHMPFMLDIGFMNNLIGNKQMATAHYLAVDMIFKNPFGKMQ